MGALLPLLVAAAPATVTAGAVGLASGAGRVLGRAAGQTVVNTAQGVMDAAGNVVGAITSFGQPRGAGQQQFMNMANQQLYYR